MNINEFFVEFPIVTKNNKDEEVMGVVKMNPKFITSYYEGIHKHDNGDETVVTYVSEMAKPNIWGFPISIKEFEERIKPYLPFIYESDEKIELTFKEIPIRYKNVEQSELMGRNIYSDEVCKFNFLFMTYYHPMKKTYNEEEGEVDVVLFGVGGNGFYTMLSLEEFESIIK